MFEDRDPGVIVRHMVGGRENLVDTGVIEQVADTGLEAWQVNRVERGGIKKVDADGARLGEIVGEQVHLDGRMDLDEEERAVEIRDQVGAEYFVVRGLHPIINL